MSRRSVAVTALVAAIASVAVGAGSLLPGERAAGAAKVPGEPAAPTAQGAAPSPVAVSDGLRIETLPAQVAATIGQPLVLAPRRVENGSAPFTRRLVGGRGASLGTLGTVTVAPDAPGVSGPYTLTITDAHGLSASTQMFVVAAPPLRLAEPRPEPATVGQRYVARFAAEGGRPPYAWSFSGQSPEGLDFVNGALTGVPVEVGGASGMVVTVTDADGRQAYSGSFGLDVAKGLAVQALPAAIDATNGQEIVLPAPTVTGGLPPYVRSVSGEGAALTPEGGLRIVPGAAGSSTTVELTVRDAGGRSAVARTVVGVAEPLRMEAYAGAVVPRGFEVHVPGVAVAGGRGANRRLLLDDATGREARPPAGLAFSAVDGAVDGIAEEAGLHGPYRMRAVDASGRGIDSLPFAIRVVEPREARASTRREVLVDGTRACVSASAADCARAGDLRTLEVRYPELQRVNELAFGCDYGVPPSGVWEIFDGRRWSTAEATQLAPCSAIIPPTAVMAVRYTRVEGAFSRIWAPRAVFSR